MRLLRWLLLVLATTASAQTTLHTFTCTTCPAPLGDPPIGIDASGIGSDIDVPTLCAADQFLTGIRPHVELTHPFIGELRIILQNPPLNSRVDLISRPLNETGSCDGDDLNATFEDGSPSFPCTATSPSNGVPVIAPAQFSLVQLAMQSAWTGAWHLSITDYATGNTGTLDDWSLTFVCDPKNVVTITASDATGDETGDPITFTITRSGVTSVPITASLDLTGTAAGADYTFPIGPLTIPAGATSATFTVTPTFDVAPEGAETVIATIRTSTIYTIGSPSSATAVIADATPSPIPTLSQWMLGALAVLLAIVAAIVTRR